jgi:hypothetical protein
MARKKKLTVKGLKRLAPKVPDLTCPIIDEAINKVQNSFNISAKKYILNKREVEQFKKLMNKIRKANNTLRESGRFWYEQMRDYIEPDNLKSYD